MADGMVELIWWSLCLGGVLWWWRRRRRELRIGREIYICGNPIFFQKTDTILDMSPTMAPTMAKSCYCFTPLPP